jgi:uncharacterized protein (TIGR02246 family)
MKKLMLNVAILSVVFLSFSGCQNSTKELSEAEKDSIIKEVRSVSDKITTAANNHDADAMMQNSWNSPDYLYAVNGVLIRGWDSMLKVVDSIHSNPMNQTFTVDVDEKIVKVIDRDAAMVITVGYLNNFPTQEGPKSIKFVVTTLMQKIDGNWVVTVNHESQPEDMTNL